MTTINMTLVDVRTLAADNVGTVDTEKGLGILYEEQGKVNLARIAFVGKKRFEIISSEGINYWFTLPEGGSLSSHCKFKLLDASPMNLTRYYDQQAPDPKQEQIVQKAHDAATFCQQRTREELLEIIPQRLLTQIYDYNRDEIEKDKTIETSAT